MGGTLMIKIPEETKNLEKSAREEVSQENLRAHVEYFCSLGQKLAGNPEELKACNYIVSKLSEYGIEAQVYKFESYVSHPVQAEFETFFPEKRSYECLTPSFSLSTPPSGLSADIVYVGDGREEDYKGRDVRGKIVLVDKVAGPQVTVAAVRNGASGIISMSAGHVRHMMIVTPVWGTPSLDQKDNIPRIPVISISGDDGKRLRSLAQAGTLRGTIKTELWEGWKTLHIPVAEIKGSKPEFLLVGGHYCSWFDGATDNATGDSSLLELSKLLKKYENKLKRGVRLAWWPGHSHGRYSGSTWYADTFWQDLYDHCIVYFNIDSPGVKGATVYAPRHQMAEVAEFNEGNVKELTDWSAVTSADVQLAHGRRKGKYTNATRPSRAADQSFWGIGLTSIGVYSMLPPNHKDRREVGGSGGAWWWHSIDDTFDKADFAVLAQDTRLYLSSILRLATMPILPFNFAMAAQDYLDALREYHEEAGDYVPLKPLMENTMILKEKAEVLDKKIANLPEDDASADKTNRILLSLSRILNPTLYTSVQPFDHQPALGTRFLPDIAPALELKHMNPDSGEFKFLVTGLKRKINKVNFCVLKAIRTIDSWPD